MFFVYFQYHGNDIEMFFVQAGSDPLLFTLEDLLLSSDVVQTGVLDEVKRRVPTLNITAIYRQVGQVLCHIT